MTIALAVKNRNGVLLRDIKKFQESFSKEILASTMVKQ